MPARAAIPLFPCSHLGATLDFYQALGFEIVHAQADPYLYGGVRLLDVNDAAELHFANLAVYGARNAFGAALVFVDDVAERHRSFADGLRSKYGRVPTAGRPRLSRFRSASTRFSVFDPTGNLVIVISRNEPAADYSASTGASSPLIGALERAEFFRDTYCNDESAANVLQGALKRYPEATHVARARALACLAELAVALGDAELTHSARADLRLVPLSDDERAQLASELAAADVLERWIVGEGS